MGWIIVIFDLPVVEDSDRKKASKFRNGLLDLGFFMVQESVYARNCISQEKQKQNVKQIETIAPTKGSITAFYLTDQQWENAVNLALYEPLPRRGIIPGKGNPDQMTLW